jgi:hypothetical protein
MKKFLAYFLGGLACLAAGAAFYFFVPLGAESRAKPALVLPKHNDVISSADSLLPLVAGKLANKEAATPTMAPVPEPEKLAKVFFAGDIMLGRSVSDKIKKNGLEYPFAEIKKTVYFSDYAIANLEGPLTKLNGVPQDTMRFHFDPALSDVLSAAGFDALSLANNHSSDQGTKGLAETVSNLSASKVAHFGEADGSVARFSVSGKNISVIGFDDVSGKINPVQTAKIIAQEKLATDIVIVYPHWGEEYKHTHSERQTMLAHSFVDAGADLVIGSHPHVVEGVEAYKGKPIFYSLGNLVFDQYFSPDTQRGLALSLNIGSAGLVSVDLLPYEIPQSQPIFAYGEPKAKALQELAKWSDSGLGEQIATGSLEKF